MADSLDLELDTVRLLIDQIRDGNDSARSELINQIQSYVGLMADHNLDKAVRAHIAPSDIVQQTMIKMVNGIDNFKGESTPEFFGWLNKIIRNEAFKARRDLTRQKRDFRRQQSLGQARDDSRMNLDLEEQQLTPQSNAMAKERVEVFHKALNGLTEDYATVIRLRNLENLSIAEIAKKMGRTKDAVNRLWYRAVLKFEKELGKLDDNIGSV